MAVASCTGLSSAMSRDQVRFILCHGRFFSGEFLRRATRFSSISCGAGRHRCRCLTQANWSTLPAMPEHDAPVVVTSGTVCFAGVQPRRPHHPALPATQPSPLLYTSLDAVLYPSFQLIRLLKYRGSHGVPLLQDLRSASPEACPPLDAVDLVCAHETGLLRQRQPGARTSDQIGRHLNGRSISAPPQLVPSVEVPVKIRHAYGRCAVSILVLRDARRSPPPSPRLAW